MKNWNDDQMDIVKKEQVLILSSGKCCWAKCFACGWGRMEAPVNVTALKTKIKNRNLKGVEKLKVFASGSFLDDKQFPREFRKWFADYIKEHGVNELVIESRPKFITPDNLKDFTQQGLELTVAIGLESADNEVLKKYKKGFTAEDFVKAAQILHENGCKVRTYLMVNIPFDTKEGLDTSVEFALKYSDSIVLINTFPHSKAPLFEMWLRGEWRPFNEEAFMHRVNNWKRNKKIELDYNNFMFVPKFPSEKRKMLQGATSEVLRHPYFEVWQDYFQRFYQTPKGKDTVLFLPCSFRKPYPKSQTHKVIHAALHTMNMADKFHKIVVSNPGVIPFEFSNYYPFNAYDWPEIEETPEIKAEYIEVIKDRVKKYLQTHKYKHYFCYLKYTETYLALKAACNELGIKLQNLLDKKVYDEIKNEKNPIILQDALECMKKNLKKM